MGSDRPLRPPAKARKGTRRPVGIFAAAEAAGLAIMTRREYEELFRRVSKLQRAVMMLAARQRLDEADALPEPVRTAILHGKTPIHAWRVHRKMTQSELARAVGISSPAMHYIETGVSYGRQATREAIAEVLRAPRWMLEPSELAAVIDLLELERDR